MTTFPADIAQHRRVAEQVRQAVRQLGADARADIGAAVLGDLADDVRDGRACRPSPVFLVATLDAVRLLRSPDRRAFHPYL